MGAAPPFLRAFSRYVTDNAAGVAAEIVDATYRAVPGYSGVPREDFVARTEQTLRAAQTLVGEGRLPAEDDFTFDRDTVRRRLREGVRVKDWIAHGRVMLGVLRDTAQRFGASAGFTEAEVMAGMLALEEIFHAGTAYAGEEFEAAAAEMLREDEARRTAFVRDGLRGALAPGAMRSGARAIGLDPDALYHAVRMRPLDAGSGDASTLLQAALRAQPTVAPRAAWAGVDGDVLGISRDDSPGRLAGAVAGIGPAVALEAIAASFASATAALEAAHAFGLAGAHRLEHLGALPLVLAGGEVGDALVDRLVSRVHGSGPAGRALVETVAAYLAHGLQPGATAEALHLHVNSLRKRLHRYEELTGADLSSVDDLVAVWWALKRGAVNGLVDGAASGH